MIPLNLLLIVWVWLGRIVFGVGGWFLVIFMFSVVPVLLIGLSITTLLADSPDSERSLLTQIFGPGDPLLEFSFTLAAALGALTVVGWVVLLVTLTRGRRRTSA